MNSVATTRSPIPATQQRVRAGDIPTEILLQSYSDYDLLVISQLDGKIGTLCTVTPPQGLASSRSAAYTKQQNGLSNARLPPPDEHAVLVPLFGSTVSEEALLLSNLYAAQVSSIFRFTTPQTSEPTKSLILGLGLKNFRSPNSRMSEEDMMSKERAIFHEIMMAVWTLRV